MRQALEMALEALEYPGPSWLESRQPAITAIKEALAQPEQEPVAEYVGFTDYAQTKDDAHGFGKVKRLKFIPLNARLYTTPPQQERNFCSRCGKRLVYGSIHTCTPPLENT